MKKFLEIALTLSLIAATICGITFYKAKAAKDVTDNATENVKTLAAAIIEASESKEVYEITNVEVKHELEAVGEISTYELSYSGTDTIVSSKEKLGHTIPGSTYKIDLYYNGIIKSGYDFKDIEATVDNASKTITVKLPEAKILQNSIDLNTLKQVEDVSFMSKILNPVQLDTITNRLKAIEADELLKAVDNDKILELARDNAMTIIEEALSGFQYEVIFEG